MYKPSFLWLRGVYVLNVTNVVSEIKNIIYC